MAKTLKQWRGVINPLAKHWRNGSVPLVEELCRCEESGDWKKFPGEPVSFGEMMKDPKLLNVRGMPYRHYRYVLELVKVLGGDRVIELGIPAASVYLRVVKSNRYTVTEARRIYLEGVKDWIRLHGGQLPGYSTAWRIGRHVIPGCLPQVINGGRVKELEALLEQALLRIAELEEEVKRRKRRR